MTTLKEVSDLYWRLQQANKHYDKSWAEKGVACGLAEEFHDLMLKLRKDSRKAKRARK